MSYRNERDQFIATATREGLNMYVIERLLRYATTLQRLAEAQCNGDWPFNGDRDRPSAIETVCVDCNGSREMETGIGMFPCDICHGNGKTWHRDADRDKRHDSRYTTCPKCEASGVSKAAMRTSRELRVDSMGNATDNPKLGTLVKVCPDCRTQELVEELLIKANDESPNDGWITPVFGGDPRGAVLRLSTPGFPYRDDGAGGARGLYVPARGSR